MQIDDFITTSDARKKLYSLVKDVGKHGYSVGLTHKGKVAAVLVNPQEFESWMETLEIMSDPELMQAIRKGEEQIKQGKVTPFDEFKST